MLWVSVYKVRLWAWLLTDIVRSIKIVNLGWIQDLHKHKGSVLFLHYFGTVFVQIIRKTPHRLVTQPTSPPRLSFGSNRQSVAATMFVLTREWIISARFISAVSNWGTLPPSASVLFIRMSAKDLGADSKLCPLTLFAPTCNDGAWFRVFDRSH